MSDKEQTYAVGDWLVHLIYGVGQIEKLETRPIRGVEQLCYRVRTDDSTFWLPVDNADNQRVRPLAAPKRIQRAIDVLRKAPQKMAANFQTRRKRIRNVSLDGNLSTDLKLVRDLNGRQLRKGLNSTEQEAFDSIIKRFLKEWSLSRGIEIQEARLRLNRFLEESWDKAQQSQEKIAA
jgi:RNA polymerase-interacting CarD/CdnL/TRCF family regulator